MSILNESIADHINTLTAQQNIDRAELAPIHGQSYVRGAAHPSLAYMTIPQLFQSAVSRFGPRDAVLFCAQDIRMSYYDLERAIDDVAAGFLALGLKKGDRVGIWSPNRLEWVLTQFATARIGLILVNINPAYRLGELEYALNKVECKALVTATSFKSSNYIRMLQDIAPELENCAPGQLQATRLPHLKHIIVMGHDIPHGTYSFDQLCKIGGPAQKLRLPDIDKTLNPDDAINIQFTSGTTGAPKGATLSHYNIVNNGRYVTDYIALTDADKLVIPVPLYHCFGMVMGVLGAVSKGATMVFPSEGFDAAQTLDATQREKCTALYGVPTMFVSMLEDLEKTPRDLSSLRTGIMAGSPCPVEVMERVNSEMNMKEVTIAYGMTETSPVSFQSFRDDPTDKRCETVGRIHPNLEVKIIDADGHIVPPGTQGELCTRGYSVMKGYWQDTDKTRTSIIDGWMHSGDLAVINEHGFCSIVGRVKDMIIRGGENVYPREIEEYLIRHPKVSDVQVFGVPDQKFGEEVCAWAIAKPGKTLTSQELRESIEGKIAHFKVPKHIRIVEELPMTITGKPQKFVMRDKMEALLKAEGA
ncbi:MAG: AMP-binding protein [Aestuariivita sp.]|nr:AMP-binding protein [Aestuariivita sp.]